MHYAAWNHEALTRRNFDNTILQIDEEQAFNGVEELVVCLVFVPAILPFNHADPHYGAVHLAKRLVEPFELASIRKRLHIDEL